MYIYDLPRNSRPVYAVVNAGGRMKRRNVTRFTAISDSLYIHHPALLLMQTLSFHFHTQQSTMTTSKGKGKAQPVNKEQDIFNQIMALKADVQAMYALVDQLDKSIQDSGVKLAEMLQERHRTLKAELSDMMNHGDVEPLSINHNA